MNKALWGVQVLLALMFGMVGSMKAFTPMAELAARMPAAAESPEWLVRFIGVSELAGAIGLIVPAATKIKPALTPLAAVGIMVIMVLAAGTHIMRGELAEVPINIVLFALAALVAWGRTSKVPIRAKTVA